MAGGGRGMPNRIDRVFRLCVQRRSDQPPHWQEKCLSSSAPNQAELAEHFTKRKIVVAYRGIDLELQVHSLREEVDLKVCSLLKEMSVNREGGIQPLRLEEIIFGDDDADKNKSVVDENVVAPFETARETANQAVVVQEAAIGKDMADVLNKRAKMLEQVDRSFRIELALVSHMAATGGGGMGT